MWVFIIVGVIIFIILSVLYTNKNDLLSGSDSGSSIQRLSSNEIRSYFPYIDTQTALLYRDAILKGQTTFNVKRDVVEQWNRNRILKRTAVPSKDSMPVDQPKEYTKLTWWKLQQYFPIMDSEISANYFADHLLDESKWFTVKTTELEEWEKKLAAYKNNEKNLHQTATNNNEGIAFEKQGDTASAIEVYEKNLEMGYPASHSYNRLMIIYHKEKRYEDEIRVIKKAIEVFSLNANYNADVIKWQKRLSKLII